MKEWRFIDTGTGHAAWNMALDEALGREAVLSGIPVLRLYGWERSLSFGKFSKPRECLDMAGIEESGISCVRRPTGGGVLVHGGDLSYALIFPGPRERGVRENYRHWCGFLLSLYERLGLPARFADVLAGPSSAVCLAAHEPEDIVIEGRKIGGNAQLCGSNLLFLHGTIPLFLEREFFEPFFRGESGLRDAATLEEMGVKTTHGELVQMAAEVFRERFGIQTVEDILTPSEERLAGELAARKYSEKGWTFDGKSSMA